MAQLVGPDEKARRDDCFVGRASEVAAMEELLGRAARGESGAVVVAGPAGIGKSSLLRVVVAGATAYRVLPVVGVESEMAFGYAGVHQLVLPLVETLEVLPAPQRAALRTMLGLVQGDPPDAYLVGLGMLSLLAETAHTQPILVVIDDAQWLDDESLRVLSFVARRLHADRVAVLVGCRSASDGRTFFEGVPHLELDGLAPADGGRLLAAMAGTPVDEGVADLLVAATSGNPLALAELPASLTADQLRAASALPEPLPIGNRLSSVFEPRFRTLDESARALLLLAAAEREGDPALLQRAASAIAGVRWEQELETLERTGLVAFTHRVEFRHPLVRSAVYYAASPAERRRAHAALAEALDTADQADRRAWHRGAAAGEADECVAAELEAAAERARRRGGVSVAAAYLWRAAELTPDTDRAAARLLEAARAELTAGRSRRAREILDRATATGLTTLHRGDAAWTEALVHFVDGDVREAGEVLARTLPDIDVDDAELVVGTCVAADAVALLGGHLVGAATRQAIGDGTSRLCGGAPEPIAQLVSGTGMRLRNGDVRAVPLWRGALADHERLEQVAGHHVHIVYLDAVLAAIGTLDDTSWDEVTRAWVELSRRTGALAAMPLALAFRSWLEVLQGRPGSAVSGLAEAEELASLTGTRGLLGSPAPAQVLLHAWQGNEQETRAGARRMMQDGHERGQGLAIDQAYAALTVLEIGCGRYEAALRAAGRAVEHDAVGFGTTALADLVESAVRCGEASLAQQSTERLADRAAACATGWSAGLLARSRALLASSDDADLLFRSAVDALSETSLVTERARTQLLHGEWLRRHRRRRDARAPLQDALEVFETTGARHFASRAATELAATGEHVRSRSAAPDALTPQEAQIARLAAAGQRNHDIASQLYITTSTVEYHLRKVFVKLGVSSRTQLAQLDLPR